MSRSYETYTRPCRQCKEPLVTTSKREVVHAQCREAYYRSYRRNPEALVKLSIQRNRSRVSMNEAPCAACGYSKITQKRKFFNKVTQRLEFFDLCPRCIAEIRCGIMEPFSWASVDLGAI